MQKTMMKVIKLLMAIVGVGIITISHAIEAKAQSSGPVLIKVLKVGSGRLLHIALLKDGALMAAITEDNSLYIFQVSDGRQLASYLLPHEVKSLVVAADDSTLGVFYSNAPVLELLGLKTCSEIVVKEKVTLPKPALCATAHAHKALFAFGAGRRAWTYSPTDGLSKPISLEEDVFSLAFLQPDDALVAASCWTRNTHYYYLFTHDPASGKLLNKQRVEVEGTKVQVDERLACVWEMDDAPTLALGGLDGVWSFAKKSGHVQHKYTLPDFFVARTYAVGRKKTLPWIAAGLSNGALCLWEKNQDGYFLFPQRNKSLWGLMALTSSKYGNALATSFANGEVSVYDMRSERLVAKEPEEVAKATSAAGADRGISVATLPTSLNLPNAKGQRWAVVVGVGQYQDPALSRLAYARRDAEAVAAFLRTPAGGSLPADHISLLVDEQATRPRIIKKLKESFGQAYSDDAVIFYFAGHGLPDGEDAYYMPAEGRADKAAGTGVSQTDIQVILNHCLARSKLWITDACHAGIAGLATRGGEASAFQQMMAQVAKNAKSTLILSATRASELSLEGPQWGGGHGVFTHYLLEGLKGKADGADGRPKDGIVTASELIDQTYRDVAKASSSRQHVEAKGSFDPEMVLALPRLN